MSEMKLNAVFTFIDKVSAPIRKIVGSTEKLEKVFGKTSKTTEKTSKSFGGFVRNLIKVDKGVKQVDASQEKAAKSAHKMAGIWGAITGSAIGIGATKLFGDMIAVNSEFEDFRNVLEVTLGSASKAEGAMQWIKEFAVKTRYELSEVTDAYVTLTSYGIDPQTRAMRSLGDAAKGMKKPYDQAIQALADAKTGEFERLKEFGIRANVTGQRIAFTYSKLGKEITVTSSKAGADIEKNILDILDNKFAGSMDKASKSWSGMISNMKDLWNGFLFKIGDMGVFKHLEGKLGRLLGAASAPKAQAKQSIAAKRISDALKKMIDAIDNAMNKINWVQVIEAITKVITVIDKVVTALGGFGNVVNIGIAAWLFSTIMGLNGLAAALGIVSVAGAPIWAIVAVVGVLAAAAFLVWRNWGTISKLWDEFWKGAGEKVAAAVASMIGKFQSIRSGFIDVINNIWNGMPAWFRGLITGTLRLIAPALPPMVQPAIGQFTQSKQTVGGEIVVNVNGPGEVKSVSTKNPKVPVRTSQELGRQPLWAK